MRKNIILSLFVLVITLSFITSPALANNNDAELLSKYEKSGKPCVMGVCDSMRSTLVHFNSPLYDKMNNAGPDS